MAKPTSTPPTFLTRAALALGLLCATDAQRFLRAARHLQTLADRLRLARVLAELHGEPEAPTEDEVTAARRRWCHQWQELGP